MKKRIFIFWSIFLAAAAFRLVQSFDVAAPDIGSCAKSVVNGIGKIADEPLVNGTGQVLVVHVQEMKKIETGQKCEQNLLIRMKTKSYPRFFFGENVVFSGKLGEPFNFKSDGGRTFNYRGYLVKDDIFYEIKSAVVSNSQTSNNLAISEKLSRSLFFIKRKFINGLEKTLGEPHAALASGLVVGEKAALGKDILEDFRTVGLVHIIVLSGFNITIVADSMRKILAFLPRMWGIVIGGLGIVLFGILVGGGATVVRSCVMAVIALSANLIRRDYSVVRALGLAGLIMLIQNPMILLHDPSFQLSFLATLGLILLASPIESKITFITEKFGIRGIVASTLATQIFVSPYILYMMGNISIIGMVVNIIVLPFIPLTMLFVFLTGAVGIISISAAQIIAYVAHLLLSYELLIVEKFAKVPYASLSFDAFPFYWVIAFYIIFFAIFSQFKFAKKSSI